MVTLEQYSIHAGELIISCGCYLDAVQLFPV